MTNRRQIKKEITAICGALATECVLAGEYIEGIDTAAFDKIIIEIAGLQSHAISRCSIAFDKVPSDFENHGEYSKARAAYFAEAFRNLKKEFNEKTGDIVKQMNALLPAAQREANKAVAKG